MTALRLAQQVIRDRTDQLVDAVTSDPLALYASLFPLAFLATVVSRWWLAAVLVIVAAAHIAPTRSPR